MGTPAVTTRGFKEEDMREVASIIADALKNPESEAVLEKAAERVKTLTEKYPLYANGTGTFA